MPEYGSFLYGEYEYGDPQEAASLLTWYFGVMWDDAFIDESARMSDFQLDRGRDHLLGSGSGGWERYKSGQVVGVFDNYDGRYDPYNTTGELYGLLRPGRLVRLSVEDSATTIVYPLMRGIVTDIQTFMQNGQRMARIIVKDGLEWLARQSVALPVQVSAEALATVLEILSVVGWETAGEWNISSLGTDSIELLVAYANSNNALTVINQLLDVEAGQMFHSRSGTLTVIAADYDSASTTQLDSSQILRDIELRQPWEVVRTRAAIAVHATGPAAAPVLLWELDVPYFFAQTTTTQNPLYLTFEFAPVYQGLPAILLTDPTGSHEINAQADGGGADNTVNYPLTVENLGSTVRVKIQRWGEAIMGGYLYYPGYIICLEVEGEPIGALADATIIAEDGPASAFYGQQTLALDTPFMQDSTYAGAYAAWIIAELATAKFFPTVQIENRTELQFGLELYMDEIELTIAALGIDAEAFRVGKISHKWLRANGQAVRTTLKLEPKLTPFDYGG